jgi:hypothetical protein
VKYCNIFTCDSIFDLVRELHQMEFKMLFLFADENLFDLVRELHQMELKMLFRFAHSNLIKCLQC